MSICARVAISREGKVYGNFALASQIGVGDFGVGYLKGWAIGDIEREFRLAKIGFAPVPATQRMFPIVQVDAVPRLEDFCDAIEVILLETIELYDTIVTGQNLDLVAACGAAPLR